MLGAMRLRLSNITPEAELHSATAHLLASLVTAPAMWTCIPTGQIDLMPAERAKLTRAGVQAGWPDFIVLHQFLYGLELKRAGGRLTTTRTYRTARGALRQTLGQNEVFPLLEDAGMRIAVCHNIDGVLKQLKMWRIPLRAHV